LQKYKIVKPKKVILQLL